MIYPTSGIDRRKVSHRKLNTLSPSSHTSYPQAYKPGDPSRCGVIRWASYETNRDRINVPNPNNLLLQEPREGGWAKKYPKNNERDKGKSDLTCELATIVSSLLHKQSSNKSLRLRRVASSCLNAMPELHRLLQPMLQFGSTIFLLRQSVLTSESVLLLSTVGITTHVPFDTILSTTPAKVSNQILSLQLQRLSTKIVCCD